MTKLPHFRHILASFKKHELTVGILAAQITFALAVISNLVLMANERQHLLGYASGVDETGLGLIEVQQIEGGSGSARVLETIHRLQSRGLGHVAAARALPLNQNSLNVTASTALNDRGGGQQITAYVGTSELVSVLGLDVIKGRAFRPEEYVSEDEVEKGSDTAGSVILSAQAAQALFGENAIGRTLYLEGKPALVVGIVDHLLSPAPNLGERNEMTALLPVVPAQGTVDFAIRSSAADLEQTLSQAVQLIRSANPTWVIGYAKTFDDLRNGYYRHDRAMVRMLVATVAALLVVLVIGVGSLVSFWVTRRTKSIGIRRALGANKKDILLHFLAENGLVMTIGVIAGIIGAYCLNIYLVKHFGESLLPYGCVVLAASLLVVSSQLACLMPALRASRVEPATAIRSG